MGLSTFFGLNIGVNALETMQQAQSVVSNNISNANTPGYARETSSMVEQAPFPPAGQEVIPGQLGQGSAVEQVSRQVNSYINQQDRLNQGTQQMYDVYSQNLTQVEGILNEPSSQSLQNSLDQFFQSWQTLSTDPTNTAARQTVISQAQTLGQTFGTVTNQLENMQQGLNQTVSGQLSQVDLYASQVVSLNTQIVQIEQTGQNPNTLLDQRGLVLDKMSQLANITYSPVLDSKGQATGAVSITLGSGSKSIQLVDSSNKQNYLMSGSGHTSAVSGTLLPTQQNQFVGSGATSFGQAGFDLTQITSGAIAGNVKSLDEVSKTLANLDSFLTQFANQVNTQQGKGLDLNGNAGQPLFTTPLPTTSSGNVILQVVPGFTTAQIAAASGPVATFQPGDNTNANAMAQLQNQTAFSGASVSTTYTSLSSGQTQATSYPAASTFDQYLASMVSGVGTEAASVNASKATAGALAQQSSNLRQSVSGVNTDGEAAKMVEYQNTYNAAAKFISVFNQMLQTLINEVN